VNISWGAVLVFSLLVFIVCMGIYANYNPSLHYRQAQAVGEGCEPVPGLYVVYRTRTGKYVVQVVDCEGVYLPEE